MINYELAILFSVLAFTYSYLLTRPNALLNGYYNYLYSAYKIDKRRAEGRGYPWAFMVLIHCEKCIAGQIAFWYSLFSDGIGMAITGDVFTAFFYIILFVSFTIFSTAVITNTYKKLYE